MIILILIQTINLDSVKTYGDVTFMEKALDGRTPAEACGIEVKGKDKWKTLIQNATNQSIAK